MRIIEVIKAIGVGFLILYAVVSRASETPDASTLRILDSTGCKVDADCATPGATCEDYFEHTPEFVGDCYTERIGKCVKDGVNLSYNRHPEATNCGEDRGQK